MTIQELIEKLSKFPLNRRVFVRQDHDLSELDEATEIGVVKDRYGYEYSARQSEANELAILLL